MSPFAAPAPISVPLGHDFERIFREHAPLVYRTAWGVLGSREDAEDVLQTVFLKLLRREFPPDLQQNPKAYLYKAAVTVSLDLLRTRRRRPVLVDDLEHLEASRRPGPGFRDSALASTGAGLANPGFGTPGSGARFDEDMHLRLYEAMAALGPEATELLVLRYMQNLSLADIAEKLGASRTAVAVRLFRSRARLRAILRGSSEKKP
jgi:RNA polymerase sigma-70 factor (ECF subfamily)